MQHLPVRQYVAYCAIICSLYMDHKALNHYSVIANRRRSDGMIFSNGAMAVGGVVSRSVIRSLRDTFR